MGVDYYSKDQSKDDNPCDGRLNGEHQFDHPFVQVTIDLRCLTLTGACDVCWRVFVHRRVQSYRPASFIFGEGAVFSSTLP